MRRKGWVRRQTAGRVSVTLSHGAAEPLTITGNLAQEARDGLILRAAELLTDDGPRPLGGEVYVPRERVLFVQSVPAQP